MKVQTVTVDEERKFTEAVDLIKIDVEGHEEMVIQGARATIESDLPILIFECFHGGGQIASVLQQWRYWIGDADCMDNPLPSTTNFVALPIQHWRAFAALKRAWSDEIIRFR